MCRYQNCCIHLTSAFTDLLTLRARSLLICEVACCVRCVPSILCVNTHIKELSAWLVVHRDSCTKRCFVCGHINFSLSHCLHTHAVHTIITFPNTQTDYTSSTQPASSNTPCVCCVKCVSVPPCNPSLCCFIATLPAAIQLTQQLCLLHVKMSSYQDLSVFPSCN